MSLCISPVSLSLSTSTTTDELTLLFRLTGSEKEMCQTGVRVCVCVSLDASFPFPFESIDVGHTTNRTTSIYCHSILVGHRMRHHRTTQRECRNIFICFVACNYRLTNINTTCSTPNNKLYIHQTETQWDITMALLVSCPQNIVTFISFTCDIFRWQMEQCKTDKRMCSCCGYYTVVRKYTWNKFGQRVHSHHSHRIEKYIRKRAIECECVCVWRTWIWFPNGNR